MSRTAQLRTPTHLDDTLDNVRTVPKYLEGWMCDEPNTRVGNPKPFQDFYLNCEEHLRGVTISNDALRAPRSARLWMELPGHGRHPDTFDKVRTVPKYSEGSTCDEPNSRVKIRNPVRISILIEKSTCSAWRFRMTPCAHRARLDSGWNSGRYSVCKLIVQGPGLRV